MTQALTIRIGTRGSPLALWQARQAEAAIKLAAPDALTEIVPITTTGDRMKDANLTEYGGKGLFVKELEEALVDGRIDMAVHSMKDMPASSLPGLVFAAALAREDARDAFMSVKYESVEALPEGATIGTSSPRRAAQMRRLRPDLKIVEYRGNVETRLKKLEGGLADATLLACAGLKRLGLERHITQALPARIMLPAIAQGIIGMQIHERSAELHDLLKRINHGPSWVQLLAERALLLALDGSCHTPIAGYAELTGKTLTLRGRVLSLDGQKMLEAAASGTLAEAERIGKEVGQALLAQGAAQLMA